MMSMLRYRVKTLTVSKVVVALFTLLPLVLATQGCRKAERSLGSVSVGTTMEIIGVTTDGMSMRSSTIKKDGVGQIVGGGSYLHGERVTIQANVFPNSKFKLVALYEKSGKCGYTKERGLVNETSLLEGYKKVKDTLCAITFNVMDDMTFVATFASSDGNLEDLNIEIGGVKVVDVENATDTISFGTIEGNKV